MTSSATTTVPRPWTLCRRFRWPVTTRCRTLHRHRSGRPTRFRKNLATIHSPVIPAEREWQGMSCANKTPNSPHLTARLALISPSPLVRPRITHAIPCPPVIGDWASISHLSELATYLRRDSKGGNSWHQRCSKRGCPRLISRIAVKQTIDKQKQTVC